MVNLSGKNLPERVTADLEELGRHGLAAKTWSSYTTAERMLSKYHREKKIRRELPVEETTILGFIHWPPVVGVVGDAMPGMRTGGGQKRATRR
jgi:hypothetical protein